MPYLGWSLFVGSVLLACGGADASPSESEPLGGANGHASGGAVSTSTNARGGTSGKTTHASSTDSRGTSNGGTDNASSGGKSQPSQGASAGGDKSATTSASAQGGELQGGASSSSGNATSVDKGGNAVGGTVHAGGAPPMGGRATGGNRNQGGGEPTGGRATGGKANAGGATASGGATATGGTFTLDCGPIDWAVEAHGPQKNRVNYAILGDGYLEAYLVAGGKFEQNIQKAMKKRFSVPIGEVYSRYRKFVNICGIKLVSKGAICSGNSALK